MSKVALNLVTPTQFAKLEALRLRSIKTETNINKQLEKLYAKEGMGGQVQHGFYIKRFLIDYYNPDRDAILATNRAHFHNSSLKHSDWANIFYKQYGNSIQQISFDTGEMALGAAFDAAVNSGNITFAKGYLSETIRLEGLKNSIEKQFPGATVTDTSPKDFGRSVQYDIEINIPGYYFNSGRDSIDGSSPDRFNLKIENKIDLNSFHFGKVSSAAMGSGKDTAYNDLIRRINRVYTEYKLRKLSSQQIIEKIKRAKGIFFIDMAIEYIIWKLDDNFPVFTTHEKLNFFDGANWSSAERASGIRPGDDQSCLLCSEIIEGILSGYINIEYEKIDLEKIYHYFSDKDGHGKQYLENDDLRFQELDDFTVNYPSTHRTTSDWYKHSSRGWIDKSSRIGSTPDFRLNLWYYKP